MEFLDLGTDPLKCMLNKETEAKEPVHVLRLNMCLSPLLDWCFNYLANRKVCFKG